MKGLPLDWVGLGVSVLGCWGGVEGLEGAEGGLVVWGLSELVEADCLPTGWRVKGSTFLSPLMEEASSSSSLLHLLEESSEYTAEEVGVARRGLAGELDQHFVY